MNRDFHLTSQLITFAVRRLAEQLTSYWLLALTCPKCFPQHLSFLLLALLNPMFFIIFFPKLKTAQNLGSQAREPGLWKHSGQNGPKSGFPGAGTQILKAFGPKRPKIRVPGAGTQILEAFGPKLSEIRVPRRGNPDLKAFRPKQPRIRVPRRGNPDFGGIRAKTAQNPGSQARELRF